MKILVGKIQKKKSLKLGGGAKKQGKLKKTGLFAEGEVEEESEQVVRVESYNLREEEKIKREKERQKRGDYLVIVPPKNRVLSNVKEEENKAQKNTQTEKNGEDHLGFGMNVLQAKEKTDKQESETRMVGCLPMDVGENPTAESYEEMPVEKFGLAFLRGLGYDEKQKNSETQKESNRDDVTRRALFLGIGARENTNLAFKAREMKYEGLLLRKRNNPEN